MFMVPEAFMFFVVKPHFAKYEKNCSMLSPVDNAASV